MTRILTSAIVALPLFCAGISNAFAFTSTPDVAPVPPQRPQSMLSAMAPVALPANVIAIGIDPQDVPESRRNVRVVGWKFLPDPKEAIVIAGRADAAAKVQFAAAKGDRVVAGTSIAAELFGVNSAMASAE